LLASAPKPYTVSVGIATSLPERSSFTARMTDSDSDKRFSNECNDYGAIPKSWATAVQASFTS